MIPMAMISTLTPSMMPKGANLVVWQSSAVAFSSYSSLRIIHLIGALFAEPP
jgi:hypothetical protein